MSQKYHKEADSKNIIGKKYKIEIYGKKITNYKGDRHINKKEL